MIDVSVIVVAWNVKKLLDECLESVFAQTSGINFEVIYVDNNSLDGSTAMVKEKYPAVTIIQNSQNLGFIKANNQGIRIAKGRYVLLLNSDTLVLDNAIEKIVRFADKHPEAAVVGGKVLNPNRTLQRNCLAIPSVLHIFFAATWLYKIAPRIAGERLDWWNYDEVREVDAIVGCFSLVRRTAFEQVGLMDEDYFVYTDDTDWCYRFKIAGWKILFTPEPQIIHYGAQTTKKAADKFVLQLHGSQLQFMQKYAGSIGFFLSRILTAFYFFVRIPYWLLYGIMKPIDRKRAFVTLVTYAKGGFFALFSWMNLLMNKQDLIQSKQIDN